MNGKKIDLSSDNISISSNNFSVDTEGNIVIQGEESNSVMKIYLTSDKSRYLDIRGARIVFFNKTHGHEIMLYNASNGAWIQLNSGNKHIRMLNNGDEFTSISLTDESGDTIINETIIEPSGIITPILTQTSLEELKKNFDKLDSVLDIIKNAEIYSYNFNSEKDEDKKHYGFVIGEKYNTPNEVISKDGKGIDTYSMSSILWKAMQEVIIQNENLQKEIEKIKM